jgi:hypothetical protein
MFKITTEKPKERIINIQITESNAKLLQKALDCGSCCQWDGIYGNMFKQLYYALYETFHGEEN